MNKDFKHIEKYAEEYNIPIMEKSGIRFLTKYIEQNKIKNILEIGSAIGYSAIKMALVDEKIKVTTIERDETRYIEALKNIKEFGLEKRITFLTIPDKHPFYLLRGLLLPVSSHSFYPSLFQDNVPYVPAQ
jgi:predicted O-methyltransferase YrrM